MKNKCGQCKHLYIQVVKGKYFYDACTIGNKRVVNANRTDACKRFCQEDWKGGEE